MFSRISNSFLNPRFQAKFKIPLYIKGLLLATGVYLYDRHYLRSCGIVGYVGDKGRAVEVIIKGLEEMQNRGYDSAGIVTYHNGELRISKFASSDGSTSDALQRLKAEAFKSHSGSVLGLGHTRWATHGEKNVLNAHPHTDLNNRIALIHNGTITNTNEIYDLLAKKNIKPKTQTDTELIALMIAMYLDEGHSFMLATRLALEKMTGTWGLAIISKDHPDQIIVARKGSPMLIGLGDKEIYIASEVSAFANYTKKYIALEDNQIFKIDPNKGKIEASKVRTISDTATSSLGSYTHWTLKEIEEQPESISRAMNYGARLKVDSARLGGIEDIKDKFLDIKNMILLGCGTSLHACLFGKYLFEELRVMNTVQVIDGSEMNNESIPKHKPGVIAISQSGETRDVVTPVTRMIEKGVTSFSIVNVVSSQLARLTGHGVYMNSGREVAVASTKSFMNSCVILAEIAIWLSYNVHPEDSEMRKKIVNSLIRLPMQTGSVIAQNKAPVKKIAQELKNAENLFIIGRGSAESIAKEGALKIKELSQLHTEGYAGGPEKYGPYALISKGVPVILVILNDSEKERMINIFENLKERGAKTIVITPDPELITSKHTPDHVLKIEENGTFTNLLSLIPMQLLAYYLSISRGLDPDHPRNLAKVVTVE